MNWDLAVQFAAILVLTFFSVASLSLLLGVLWHFGKVWFHRLRLRHIVARHRQQLYERDHTAALEIDQAWNRLYGRDSVIDRTLPKGTIFPRDPMKYDGRDLSFEQRSAFQERAAKAEGLGFLDPTDEPKDAA